MRRQSRWRERTCSGAVKKMKRTRKSNSLFPAKARGDGFFSASDTRPYLPWGVLFGQSNEYSCVPACTRMLILDQVPGARHDPNLSEAFLRTQFQTDKEGSVIARIPALLRANGVEAPYAYASDLTLAQLRNALTHGDAMVVLRDPQNIHVVIVEQITADAVALRDPLPPGTGSAYWVALEVFLTAWQRTGLGSAIVLESAL